MDLDLLVIKASIYKSFFILTALGKQCHLFKSLRESLRYIY